MRLVVYEGVTRSPTPLFNEKTLAGLGREVQTKGLMPADAVATALAALRRFRALCDTMRVKKAVGAGDRGLPRRQERAGFHPPRRERICRTHIDVISGKREAQLTALGVVSGFHRPDGIVGDLGGGSLELVDVKGTRVKRGATLPLGGLALQDRAGKSIKKADKIVRQALSKVPHLKSGKGRIFYAVGGTWRSLARLHMAQTGYPLHVMHGYVVRAKEALEFCRLVRRVNPETLSQIEVVASARRPLLPYAALVLEHILRKSKVSRGGVLRARRARGPALFAPERARAQAGRAARRGAGISISCARARRRHGEDLIEWTDTFMASSGIDETAEEKRLRHAACLLADIGWRAHPDYRGEQSLNVIAHAGFLGIDHPGRAYLALAVFFRHVGVTHDEELSPRIRELASTRTLDRARVLGAAMRVAYMVSASQPGVLPRSPLKVERHRLVLRLAGQYVPLAGDRVATRLRHLARLVGREPMVVAGRAR